MKLQEARIRLKETGVKLPASDTIGIYSIRHKPSGYVYIGQSVRIGFRWVQHVQQLESGTHTNPALQRDWRADGIVYFQFKILKKTTRSKLTATEQFFLNRTHYKYNLLDATCSHAGRKWSAITCQRISAALQVRMKDSDVRAAMKKAAAVRKASGGYNFSKAHRAKLRDAKLGTTHNYGHKIGDALRGRTHDHGYKISATKLARRH